MRVETNIEEVYLEWLYNFISKNGTDGMCSRYFNLMRILHERDFYWTVYNDDNRAADGKGLRAIFTTETGMIETDFVFGPCSVLEMMIALSRRMEDDLLYDYRQGDRANLWFFQMINHLNLKDCTDENWSDECIEKAHHAIDILLERSYQNDGKNGGLFPLRYPKRDQRHIEIWFQMQDYVRESM